MPGLAQDTPCRQHELDAHAGARLRARRLYIGYSVEMFSYITGLSTQEIERYEAGEAALVGAALSRVARFLAVNVLHFYEGFASSDNDPETTKYDSDAQALLSHIRALEVLDPEVRARVFAVVSVLADGPSQKPVSQFGTALDDLRLAQSALRWLLTHTATVVALPGFSTHRAAINDALCEKPKGAGCATPRSCRY